MKPLILLDSGAFSAWTTGKAVDVAKYCDFLLENMAWIHRYIALDVIIPEDTELAAASGFDNFKYMRSRGLDPMPVFHQGEDIRWLHKYLDEGCKYIGLAATSLSQKQQIDFWYEIAWAHLVNKDGLPLVRVHAFGDTRERALMRFPWASCDSTTWAYYAQVYAMFKFEDGTPLSFRNDERSTSSIRDIDTLDENSKLRLGDYLAKYGIRRDVFNERPSNNGKGRGTVNHRQGEDQEIAARGLMARSYLMVRYLQELEARVAAQVPKRYFPRGGFVDNYVLPDAPVDPEYKTFHMYFVTGTNRMAYPILYKANHPRMLTSYFYLKNTKLGELKSYFADPAEMLASDGPTRKYQQALESILT